MTVWKKSLLVAPAIVAALLPKIECPFCWPLYAGERPLTIPVPLALRTVEE